MLCASFSVQKLASNRQKVFAGKSLVPFHLEYLNKFFIFSQPNAINKLIVKTQKYVPMPILDQFLEFLCETYLYADL